MLNIILFFYSNSFWKYYINKTNWIIYLNVQVMYKLIARPVQDQYRTAVRVCVPVEDLLFLFNIKVLLSSLSSTKLLFSRLTLTKEKQN